MKRKQKLMRRHVMIKKAGHRVAEQIRSSSNRWLMCRNIKNSYRTVKKKQNQRIKKWAKTWIGPSQEDIQIAEKHMERLFTSLVIKNMQNTTTKKCRCVCNRMARTKKTDRTSVVKMRSRANPHMMKVLPGVDVKLPRWCHWARGLGKCCSLFHYYIVFPPWRWNKYKYPQEHR